MNTTDNTDHTEIIEGFEKNKIYTVVVSMEKFRGKENFSVRLYFRDNAGELRPTRQGVTLPVEKFKDFNKAIRKLEEVLFERGLLKLD